MWRFHGKKKRRCLWRPRSHLLTHLAKQLAHRARRALRRSVGKQVQERRESATAALHPLLTTARQLPHSRPTVLMVPASLSWLQRVASLVVTSHCCHAPNSHPKALCLTAQVTAHGKTTRGEEEKLTKNERRTKRRREIKREKNIVTRRKRKIRTERRIAIGTGIRIEKGIARLIADESGTATSTGKRRRKGLVRRPRTSSASARGPAAVVARARAEAHRARRPGGSSLPRSRTKSLSATPPHPLHAPRAPGGGPSGATRRNTGSTRRTCNACLARPLRCRLSFQVHHYTPCLPLGEQAVW
mmetsp:Transcript_7060/g.17513  ORF Transcript_7060/g.17513 Transcript_7060/m.17513 type:complete len:301 (+) Transcript_7060:605-1507(+)